MLTVPFSVSAHYILNRFTINSINHNHYIDADSRLALRDDTNNPIHYWLRSAGLGYEVDHHFRTVAGVWTGGNRSAAHANNTAFGFRPIL